MAWWLWVLLGFALVLCELLTPGGFFFLFFGLGAVAVGALVWLGAAGPAWLQWFLFSLISIGFLVPLRGRLLRRMAAGDDAAARVDALVGQVAVLLDDLPPGEVGKAELRGTAWNARNEGERALRRGQRGRVTRVDGLTLWLQPE
ncbi:MAG: NfeD family protein [Deltaproteobacteria bacterium]|nr:MAG: NfeD family protein [Deltaproteobacteria bacterium]